MLKPAIMSTKNNQKEVVSEDQCFTPHVTVAVVVEHNGQFLMVEEYSSDGKAVINQPAGHLEANETLIEAAIRETLEETRWHVEITGVLNMNLYLSPNNGVTYHRTTFIGSAIKEDPHSPLDDGIIQALWLTPEEVDARKDQHRSPVVSKAIQQYLNDPHYPLAMIADYR